LVRSYELPNIREWYAASEFSSRANSACSSEAGSPSRGAESMLMLGAQEASDSSAACDAAAAATACDAAYSAQPDTPAMVNTTGCTEVPPGAAGEGVHPMSGMQVREYVPPEDSNEMTGAQAEGHAEGCEGRAASRHGAACAAGHQELPPTTAFEAEATLGVQHEGRPVAHHPDDKQQRQHEELEPAQEACGHWAGVPHQRQQPLSPSPSDMAVIEQVDALIQHEVACLIHATPPPSCEDSEQHDASSCCSRASNSSSSSNSQLSSPSLPMPDLSICHMPCPVDASLVTTMGPTRRRQQPCVSAGAEKGSQAFFEPSSCACTPSPQCSAHNAGDTTSSATIDACARYAPRADQQRVCVSLVPGAGAGNALELKLTYKSSARAAQILAALCASSKGHPAQHTVQQQQEEHSGGKQNGPAAGPSSARSAKILAALQAKAGSPQGQSPVGPAAPVLSSALVHAAASAASPKGVAPLLNSEAGDQAPDVCRSMRDQCSWADAPLSAFGSSSSTTDKDQGPSTGLRKAKGASRDGMADVMGLKELLQRASKHAPTACHTNKGVDFKDSKYTCHAVPSANVLAAQPEQQVVQAYMVSAPAMPGPGLHSSSKDTCQRKDTGSHAYKGTSAAVASLKQSDSMLKGTWGSSDISDDDTRQQQQQQQPSIAKRRQQQQQRLHDTLGGHPGSVKQQHAGTKQGQFQLQQQPMPQQQRQRQQPSTSQQHGTKLPAAVHKQSTKQPAVAQRQSATLPATSQKRDAKHQQQKPHHQAASCKQQPLPQRHSSAPKRPSIPPLRLDTVAPGGEEGSMPALTASDSPVVSERAPRSSRAGIVSPYQKRMAENQITSGSPSEPAESTKDESDVQGEPAPEKASVAPLTPHEQSACAAKKACCTMTHIVNKIVPDFKGPSLGDSICGPSDGGPIAAALSKDAADEPRRQEDDTEPTAAAAAAARSAQSIRGSSAAAAAISNPPLPMRSHSLQPLNLAQLPPPRLSPRMFVDAAPCPKPAAPAASGGGLRAPESQVDTTFGSPVEGEEATPPPWEAGPDSCKAGREGGQLGEASAACQGVTEAAAAPGVPAAAEGARAAGSAGNAPAQAECGVVKEAAPKQGAAAAAAPARAVKVCTAEWVGQDNDANVDEEIEVEVPAANHGLAGATPGTVHFDGQGAQAANNAKDASAVSAAAQAVSGPGMPLRAGTPAAQPKAKKSARGGGLCVFACFAPKVREE